MRRRRELGSEATTCPKRPAWASNRPEWQPTQQPLAVRRERWAGRLRGKFLILNDFQIRTSSVYLSVTGRNVGRPSHCRSIVGCSQLVAIAG